MTPTHLHLLLNHIPIIGTAFGSALLLYGIFTKSKSVINAALLAFIVTALFTIPVFLTGEPAEETVENIAGVDKASIEDHEETAELALWMMEALGVFSLAAFVMHKKDHSLGGKLVLASLIFSLITFALMVKAGNEGGKIRHTEITGSLQGGNPNEPTGEQREHDND